MGSHNIIGNATFKGKKIVIIGGNRSIFKDVVFSECRLTFKEYKKFPHCPTFLGCVFKRCCIQLPVTHFIEISETCTSHNCEFNCVEPKPGNSFKTHIKKCAEQVKKYSKFKRECTLPVSSRKRTIKPKVMK